MQGQSATSPEQVVREKISDMHLKLLDDLVNVNSLFTAAVFIGLSFASPDQRSLDDRRECNIGRVTAKTLVLYEVLSFALFLVSSLAAKSLKVLLSIYTLKKISNTEFSVKFCSPLLNEIFLKRCFRRTVFLISAVASALGVIFLTLSIVVVIQTKLGILSCHNSYTLGSVISMILLVAFSLILYLPPVIFAAIADFEMTTAATGTQPATTTTIHGHMR